jgi:hypothetical protein
MGFARMFAIVLNAIFGMIGWFLLLKSPVIAIIIIALNWIIFWRLMVGKKKEAMRKQFQKQQTQWQYENR